jgi:molybdopterin biosynthesis enzyme
MSLRYYVAYDLVKASIEQYTKLCNELRRLGAKEVLKSDWVVRWSGTSVGLRDHLKKFIHSDDRIVAVQMNGDWASYDALADINTI